VGALLQRHPLYPPEEHTLRGQRMDYPADQDRAAKQHQVHFDEAGSVLVFRPRVDRVDREALPIGLPVLLQLRQPDIHSCARILSTWLPAQPHTWINDFTVS